ncbi:hypothetical protein K523DRAFT_322687 [Schizophyllum commune Tattone D]|nr:hypothetical protein K523DRAFT_322687 [Schizophyllum commune Tattone D]
MAEKCLNEWRFYIRRQLYRQEVPGSASVYSKLHVDVLQSPRLGRMRCFWRYICDESG